MFVMATWDSAVARGRRMGRRERRRAGDQLRIARVAGGLSQRGLAMMVGLSHSTIGRMERGEVQRITVDRLAVVAAVLGFDLRSGSIQREHQSATPRTLP